MGKRFDPELRQHILKLVLEEGKKNTEVSREFGIPTSTIVRWKREHRQELQTKSEGQEYLTPTEQANQQRALEKEIAELKEENDILKKAMHIFSKDRL